MKAQFLSKAFASASFARAATYVGSRADATRPAKEIVNRAGYPPTDKKRKAPMAGRLDGPPSATDLAANPNVTNGRRAPARTYAIFVPTAVPEAAPAATAAKSTTAKSAATMKSAAAAMESTAAAMTTAAVAAATTTTGED